MKKNSHFNFFWEKAIYPSIKLAKQDIDNDFKEKTLLNFRDTVEYYAELEDMYRRKREWLKQKYLPHDEGPKLDFHKLGAIICRCIIGVKPVTYSVSIAEEILETINADETISHSDKMNWVVSNLYVNYKIAFFSAVGIAYADLLYWAYKKQEDAKINGCPNEDFYFAFAKELEKQKNLSFYPKSAFHENFVNSTIIALMKEDLLCRDFNYLMFSIILYQLQENTKRIIFSDIMKETGFTFDDLEWN